MSPDSNPVLELRPRSGRTWQEREVRQNGKPTSERIVGSFCSWEIEAVYCRPVAKGGGLPASSRAAIPNLDGGFDKRGVPSKTASVAARQDASTPPLKELLFVHRLSASVF